MRVLLLSVILLMSTLISSEINWKEIAEKQAYNNTQLVNRIEKQKNHIAYQDKLISDLDKEIEIQKIKERERLIVVIPFTQIGVSKDHIIGAMVMWLVIAL